MITRRELFKLSSAAGIAAVPTIQTLTVHPHEALVVSVPELLDDEAVEHLTESVAKMFPGTKVLVLDGGMTLSKFNAEVRDVS